VSARLAYSPAEPEPGSTQTRQQILLPRNSGGVILTGSDRYESFGPLEHLKALHPPSEQIGRKRGGTVSFARLMKDKSWKEWAVDISGAPQIAKEMLDRGDDVDIYVSQQCFKGWRLTNKLLALGSLYCDIDFHGVDGWRNKDPRSVLIAVFGKLDEARIPSPSYVLDTGRGLLLVWLHNLISAQAQPRWAAVERHIVAALKDFGADAKATDSARVFRLVGSMNSKAEVARCRVGMIWCIGDPSSPFRYDFDTLADDVLPFTRAELIALRVEKAKRALPKKKDGQAPKKKLSVADWGETLLADLEALRLHRHPNGRIPSGRRDAWLFLVAIAISWTCPSEVLEQTMEKMAAAIGGWPNSETRSRMHAVFKRAKNSAAGETIVFRGREIDPRYRIRAATVIEWLGISPDEQRVAGLRMLIDDDTRRERGAERSREFRKRRGATNRQTAREARLLLGRKALYMQAKEGLTRDDLADRFGVSAGQISKAMAEARRARNADRGTERAA